MIGAPRNYGYGEHEVSADGLIDRLPCRACGEPTLSTLQVDVHGKPHHWVYLCRPCKAKRALYRAPMAIVFDGLIADGWNNEDANRLIIQAPALGAAAPLYTIPPP